LNVIQTINYLNRELTSWWENLGEVSCCQVPRVGLI